MKKILLLLLVCPLFVMAQVKVAVCVTGTDKLDDATKQIIGSELVSGIVTNNNFVAVERTADFLAEIQKEQSMNPSYAPDDQQLREIGKQMGVSLICVANVMSYQDSYYIQARLLNVNTVTIEATARETSTLTSLEEIVSASERLSSKLMEQVQTKQEEQTRVAETEAKRQQALRDKQAQEEEHQQELMKQSLDDLEASIISLVETINSYVLVIRNYKKHPYKIIIDGHALGVVNPYKVQSYRLPIEWYGKIQAVQTQGYMLYPTIFNGKVPPQKKQASYVLDLK